MPARIDAAAAMHRVEELESQVTDLEERLEHLETMDNATDEDMRTIIDKVNDHSRIIREFSDTYNRHTH